MLLQLTLEMKSCFNSRLELMDQEDRDIILVILISLYIDNEVICYPVLLLCNLRDASPSLESDHVSVIESLCSL